MAARDDLLNECLARLDAGEPLEACLAGVPGDEAALVRKAALLRAVPDVGPAPERAAAGRREFLRHARQQKPLATPLSPPRAAPRWILPAALAGGSLALFACFTVLSLLAGLGWLWQARGVAQNPTPGRQGVSGAQSTQAAATAIALAAPGPDSAVLAEAHGRVEVQASGEAWSAADGGQLIRAGQRVRTGALSSVTFAFYDGSQARLGPNSELSIDALDAQRQARPRLVRLTQWSGESDHDVAHADDPASVYEVNTPSGSGTAKGTSFHVVVTALVVRFDVFEGEVAVTHLEVTVSVVAGQSTTIEFGETPDDPVFHISGEGALEATGDTWRVAGRRFLIDDSTVILGDPRLGDWVRVEGRLLPNGQSVADRILLLHRSRENRFVFTGRVESIGPAEWTIAGRAIRVDELTTIAPGFAIGDSVEVQGGVAQDGTLWASSIQRAPIDAFKFAGVVQHIAPQAWSISGITVTVNASTTIEPGIAAGDVVEVAGRVREDGAWLATSIRRAAADTFDFVGVVLGREPWVVGGVELVVDARTDIDEAIEPGDRVRVTGRILPDGRWLADRISRLDQAEPRALQFFGRVNSKDPWRVGGLPLGVDDQTVFVGDIRVGDLVRVRANLLPEGRLIAREIHKVRAAGGCFTFSAIVQGVSAGQLVLLDGQTIDLGSGVSLVGDVRAASVVVIQRCVAEDGSVLIVSVIVVFQLPELPPLPPPVDVCAAVGAVVIANGQAAFPSGQLIQLGNNTWIEITTKGKGDKVEIRLNGGDHKVEIKIKAEGKHPAIEVKAKGKGKNGILVIGAGKYPITSTLVLSICASEAGPIIIVSSGGIIIAPPPWGDLCVSRAGEIVRCPRPDDDHGHDREDRDDDDDDDEKEDD